MAVLIDNGVNQDNRWTDSIVVSNNGGSSWTPIRKENISKISVTGPIKANTLTYSYENATRLYIYGAGGDLLFDMELQDLDPSSSYSDSNGASSPWDTGTPDAVSNAKSEINSWL